MQSNSTDSAMEEYDIQCERTHTTPDTSASDSRLLSYTVTRSVTKSYKDDVHSTPHPPRTLQVALRGRQRTLISLVSSRLKGRRKGTRPSPSAKTGDKTSKETRCFLKRQTVISLPLPLSSFSLQRSKFLISALMSHSR